MSEYKRFEGESDEELIFRICSDKESIGSWDQVKDILNKLLDKDYGESTYRKKFAAFNKMFLANRSRFIDSDKQLEALREEERRLEIEKIKFRDERNAWSAQNRIQARAEAKLDNIEDALCDMGRIYFPEHPAPVVTNADRTILIMLNDLHIGATFDNFFGKYDLDTARNRLGRLLEEVKIIAKRHDADECYVSLGGDAISGNIHLNLRITNRENVISQIKRCSELVASFCYELTKIFSTVNLVSVDGNHSRIDKKEEAMGEERLDSLIPWAVSMALHEVENFKYIQDNNINNGIALINIRGKYYISVHGDYDSFNKAGVQNLITMIRVVPYGILFGHKHYCAIEECNGVKMIQGGALCGSGDEFTVEKRIRGKASQMVCVCSPDGIEAYYPVELD